MKKPCKKCGDRFELLPGKPGFANVCPKCSEQSPEVRGKQIADAQSRHNSLTASLRTNARHREEERKRDAEPHRLRKQKLTGLNPAVKVPKREKIFSSPPDVPLQSRAIQKIEEVMQERRREAASLLVPCTVGGCTAKLNPSKVERHLRRVHRRGIQSKSAVRPVKMRLGKGAIGSAARHIVSNSIPDDSSRSSYYGQAIEKNLDATKGYANAYRDNGQFGSHPSYDGFDDESGPE